MIDIPLGKALAPVEAAAENAFCNGCALYEPCSYVNHKTINWTTCMKDSRKDGKNVIFKLVDYEPDLLHKIAGGENK